jgi:hypothetical protein
VPRPKSISASSIDSFVGCEMRWAAESTGRVSVNSPPGLFGTALHAALDKYIEKMYDADGMLLPEAGGGHVSELLLNLWAASCGHHLGWGSDYEPEGRDLLERWMQTRTLPPQVLSREVKEQFEIEPEGFPGETQKVTYIVDRVDMVDGAVKVIDYKSQYLDVNPASMRRLVQPALYACAMRRKYGVTEVEVEYDMLRYQPVSVFYSAPQMDAFEVFLSQIAGRMWSLGEPRETLNSKCRYCPRKGVCKTLLSATDIGWTPAMPLEEVVALHEQLKDAVKGIEALLGEVDTVLLEEVRRSEEGTVDLDRFTLGAKSKTTVRYDPEVVLRVIGDEAVQFMSVSKTALDKELNRKRNPRFTPDEVETIKSLAQVSRGEPYVTVTPKTPVDGE